MLQQPYTAPPPDLLGSSVGMAPNGRGVHRPAGARTAPPLELLDRSAGKAKGSCEPPPSPPPAAPRAARVHTELSWHRDSVCSSARASAALALCRASRLRTRRGAQHMLTATHAWEDQRRADKSYHLLPVHVCTCCWSCRPLHKDTLHGLPLGKRGQRSVRGARRIAALRSSEPGSARE